MRRILICMGKLYDMNVLNLPRHRMENKVSKLLRPFHLASTAISSCFYGGESIAAFAKTSLGGMRTFELHKLSCIYFSL